MTYTIKAELIKPFLINTVKVLSRLEGLHNIQRGKPCIKSSNKSPGLLSGIVDLSGDELEGSFALTFSAKFSTTLCTTLFKDQVRARKRDVKDLAITTAGELAQNICLEAMELLEPCDTRLEMTAARAIVGNRHQLKHLGSKPAIQIPFVSSWGAFYVESNFCTSEEIYITLMPDADGYSAVVA